LHWKPQAIAQETGQIRAGIGPFLTRRMRQRRAYAYTEVFPTRGNKSVRAQSVRGRMALEGLHVPTDAPWYPAFRSELLSFPAGRHDDAVDALGLVGRLLNKMANGFALKVEEKKPDRLAYVIRHDGSVRSNMSVFDIVQAKLRRKAMD
jgi:predicted phage terminase large subunit-like protein